MQCEGKHAYMNDTLVESICGGLKHLLIMKIITVANLIVNASFPASNIGMVPCIAEALKYYLEPIEIV